MADPESRGINPPTGIFKITASDVDQLVVPRALYIGVSGNLKVSMLDGSVETIPVFAGSTLPGFYTRIWSTGSDAAVIASIFGWV